MVPKVVLVDMDNTIADFDGRALEILKERHPEITVSRTDLTKFPFAANFPNEMKPEINALFQAADSNNNGHIDFFEFHAAVNAAREDDSTRLDLGWWVKKRAQANIRDDAAGRLFFMVFLLCAL